MVYKYICNKKGDMYYGYLGESTGYQDYYVGDTVLYSGRYNEKYSMAIVVKNTSEQGYSLYGWCTDDLKIKNGKDFTILKIVVPYNLLTKEILNHIHYGLTIKEIEKKKITIEEIEKELGYKIELID